MSDDRPKIPRPLRRRVQVEAGHRCAIPTCRETSALEIDHIKPWAKAKKHEFHNLILWCSNCHTRKTAGLIDRKAMKQYKANLANLNSRFSLLERRLIAKFAKVLRDDGEEQAMESFRLPCYSEMLVSELLDLGLLKRGENLGYTAVFETTLMDPHIAECYEFTRNGLDFLRKYTDGESLS